MIVPDVTIEKKKLVQILTPRLAHREDAAPLKMIVTKEKPNARIRR